MVAVGDILISFYPWTKAFHIMAVIAWMAGLFYLPRLFVYHAERAAPGTDQDALFQLMERRLYRAIMRPAMAATWVFGLMLLLTPGLVDWSAYWPWTKAAGVIAMTLFHEWLGRRLKDFSAARNEVSGRSYRIMNELPTLLMVVIVLSVVMRF